MPLCFCQVGDRFLGVVLVTFLCLVRALLCVFLFRFVCGYVGYGLVMVWYCVGNCFVFVNSVSLCEHGLRFWFVCVMMCCFCFVSLVTFFIRVLTAVALCGIRARARLINRYSVCDADHALPGRQGFRDPISL